MPWALSPLRDPFLAGKLLLLVTPFLLWRRRIGWEGGALLIITAGMAMSSYRHVPLFLLAAGAYLPAALPNIKPDPRVLAAFAVAAVLWNGALLTRGLDLTVPTRPSAAADYWFPYGAVRFMKANGLHGNIANQFDWGEFLMWEMPDCRVSFDGRLETVYPKATIDENLAFLAGKQPGLAQQWGADFVLVPFADPRGPTPLVQALMKDPFWAPLYRSDNTALFIQSRFMRRGWIMPPQDADAELVPLTGPPSVNMPLTGIKPAGG
jgi:hypothetical protein